MTVFPRSTKFSSAILSEQSDCVGIVLEADSLIFSVG